MTDALEAVRFPSIAGESAAAILLMLLDEAEAAAVLRHFEPDEVQQLAGAMFAAANAGEDDVERALDRFVGLSRKVPNLAVGAEPRIRKVMTEALGNTRADNILANIAPQSSGAVLDMLRWMEPAAIARIVVGEPPQVGALIVSVLKPEIAVCILESLEPDRQADLLCRAALLTSVSAGSIADLEAVLIDAATVKQAAPKVRVGGRGGVARIVNGMKKTDSARLLKQVRKRDKALADTIEAAMFTFDDLIALDVKTLGAVLRTVDGPVLTVALKGSDEAVLDKLLGTMSARAAQTIRDDMVEGAPVKRSDIDDAQREIIAIARGLADDGTIQIGGGQDDYV